jgi:hypothetical protein
MSFPILASIEGSRLVMAETIIPLGLLKTTTAATNKGEGPNSSIEVQPYIA